MHYNDITNKSLLELKSPLSHYRQVLRGDWNIHPELEDYFTKNGYKILGSGFFSNVWGKPGEKFVIKVGNNDTINDCYLDFMNFIKSNQSQHLPKIGKIREFKSWYLIPIEKLDVLTLPTNRDDAHFVHAYWKCHKKFSDEAFCDRAEAGKTTYPELYSLLEKLKTQFVDKCGLDIGFSNMMLRGQTLVITDPLGGRLKGGIKG